MNLEKTIENLVTFIINLLAVSAVFMTLFGFIEVQTSRSGDYIKLTGYRAGAAFQLATGEGVYGRQAQDDLLSDIEGEEPKCGLRLAGFDEGGEVRIGIDEDFSSENEECRGYSDEENGNSLKTTTIPLYSPGSASDQSEIPPGGIGGFFDDDFDATEGFYEITVADRDLEAEVK